MTTFLFKEFLNFFQNVSSQWDFFDQQSPINYGWKWITFYFISNTTHAHQFGLNMVILPLCILHMFYNFWMFHASSHLKLHSRRREKKPW